jgi:hypothetical protein
MDDIISVVAKDKDVGGNSNSIERIGTLFFLYAPKEIDCPTLLDGVTNAWQQQDKCDQSIKVATAM